MIFSWGNYNGESEKKVGQQIVGLTINNDRPDRVVLYRNDIIDLIKNPDYLKVIRSVLASPH